MTTALLTPSGPPSPEADFQGVFKATMNGPGSRRMSLVFGIVLLTICGLVIAKAVASLVVQFVVSRSNGGEVIIFAVVALVSLLVGLSKVGAWKELRKRPDGVFGSGIRVLPDGEVVFGDIDFQPVSIQEVERTGRGRVQTLNWKPITSYSDERNVLVNIIRTKEMGLTVGHIVLNVTGRRVEFLSPISNSRVANTSDLWIADGSKIIWLNRVGVISQLEMVSRVLAPIPRRSGGQLMLTLTEIAGDGYVSATNSLQAVANQALSENVFPLGLPLSDDSSVGAKKLNEIVIRYGYKLKPNEDAARFRGW